MLRSDKVHRLIGWLMIIAIVALSVGPNAASADTLPMYHDKIAHGIAYGVLMVWFSINVTRAELWVVYVRLFTLGVILELIQYLLPHRHATVDDILANFVGLTLVFLAVFFSWPQFQSAAARLYDR